MIGGPQPLRVADLISLAALPALVIGLATITADRVRTADGQLRPAAGGRAGRRRPGRSAGAVLDSALLVVSLFAIGLVTLFGRTTRGSALAGPRSRST